VHATQHSPLGYSSPEQKSTAEFVRTHIRIFQRPHPEAENILLFSSADDFMANGFEPFVNRRNARGKYALPEKEIVLNKQALSSFQLLVRDGSIFRQGGRPEE
jgi:hypothetical protein